MATTPDIPGNYEKVYTLTTDSLLAFEAIKIDLLALEGIEDAWFDSQPSPSEMTLLTDGTVADEAVQQIAVRHGYQALPKKFFIS